MEETVTRLFISRLSWLWGLSSWEELSSYTTIDTRHPGSRWSTGYKKENERNITEK